MRKKAVAAKVKDNYEKLNALQKAEKFASKPKSDEWFKKSSEFNDRLTCGYDINCKNKNYLEKLERKYQVKMTADDERFYGKKGAAILKDIIHQVLKSAAKLHERGIVHR